MDNDSFGNGYPTLDDQGAISPYCIPTNVNQSTATVPGTALPSQHCPFRYGYQRSHHDHAEQLSFQTADTSRSHQYHPRFHRQTTHRSTPHGAPDGSQACINPEVLDISTSRLAHLSATMPPSHAHPFQNIQGEIYRVKQMNQYMDQDCNTQSMALDHSTSVHSQASPTAGDNSYQDFQALHSILQDEEQLRQTADQKNSFTTMNVGINDFSDTNALSESLEQSALGPPRHQAHALSDFREPLSAPPRGRTQSKSTGRAGLAQLPSRKCVEAKCPRNFRPTAPGQEFCGRHQKKWERNNAAPLTFYMDLRINSFEAAHDQVYPRAGALHLDGDDLDTVRQHEHEWILRLLYAASKPYEGNSEFRNRQQKVYNGKGYNNLDANVRIRFLYKVALTFHEGGKAVYARGGDNGGYGKADVTLKLSERLMRIIHHMEKNKRVCMDVIEGRGVIALVENPDKYEKRKRQNKKSNKKKQKAQRRGLDGALEQDEHEGSDSDSDPSTDDDDSDHEEDCDAAASMTPGTIGQTSNFEPNQDPGSPVAKLPSGKRKRATRSTTTKAKAPKRLKKSVQGNETPPNDLLQNFDHNAPYDFGDSGLGGATNKNLGCDYNAAVAQQVGDTGGPVTRSRAGTGQTHLRTA